MKSTQQETLASLYDLAIALTTKASMLLRNTQIDEARVLLSQRCGILRDINRKIAFAPEWGHSTQVDQAALSYIRADRDLEQSIEATCAQ